MRIGLSLATQAAPGEAPSVLVDRLVEQVRHADRWGFETCVFTEHHQQPDGSLSSPLAVMAALSAVTSRIRLATAVLLAPLYDPIRLAEDIATVDLFAKGRLAIGVGTGYAAVDFDPFGVDPHERGIRTNETLEVLRRAWTGEVFSYRGRYLKYRNVVVSPRPFQAGGPRIWVGGVVEASLHRAARLGDGWIAPIIAPIHDVSRLASRYRKARQEFSGDCGEVTVLREGWVGASRAEASRDYGEPVLSTHRLYFDLGAYTRDSGMASVGSSKDLTLEAVAEDRFVIGAIDDVVGELRRYRDEVSADRVILRLGHPGGPRHEAIMEAIEIIGREVIPLTAGNDW